MEKQFLRFHLFNKPENVTIKLKILVRVMFVDRVHDKVTVPIVRGKIKTTMTYKNRTDIT